MSKAHSTDLFDLIKSLNPSEKGYIKKFALRSSSKRDLLYLSLFDAIDKQKAYNENAILKTLKHIKQLPELKNYLYSALCNALVSYHSESDVKLELLKMIGTIGILYNKGLDAQCWKLLDKAKEIARRNELFSFLIEFSYWEKLLISNTRRDLRREKKSTKILNEIQELLQNLKTDNDHWELKETIFNFYYRNKRITKDLELEGLEKSINNSFIKTKSIPPTRQGKLYFYQLNAFYYKIKGDLMKSYLYQKECLLLFKNDPEKILQNSEPYLGTLNNYFNVLVLLKKYKEVEKCILLFRSIKNFNMKQIGVRNAVFMLYLAELDFYLKKGEFEKGIKLSKEIEESLEKYYKTPPKEIEQVFYINSAIAYFITCNFRDTLYYLNKIMAGYTLNIRNDIECFARIINLITHFEIGNIDMLVYTVQSTYRFLYKRGEIYMYEILLLNFIKRELPNISTNAELIRAFIKLKNELIEVVRDPVEQKALESFDFISWLESKIENRSFGEILREKSRFSLEEEND